MDSFESLVAREKKGEVMPYELMLIPQFEEIKLEFREAFEDNYGAFASDNLSFLVGPKNQVEAGQQACEPVPAMETK